MFIVNDRQMYPTIIDAAKELSVSTTTVRRYIEKGIIPEPPFIQFGVQKVKYFPQNYMAAAKKRLQK
jgi:predicted site-specific integrase-resolvase